jgi:hypothetical protein
VTNECSETMVLKYHKTIILVVWSCGREWDFNCYASRCKAVTTNERSKVKKFIVAKCYVVV